MFLTDAYAMLSRLQLEDNNDVTAYFKVQDCRDDARDYKALELVEVKFKWNRKDDIIAKAYYEARTQVIKTTNKKTLVKEKITGPLFGWKNDIVDDAVNNHYD